MYRLPAFCERFREDSAPLNELLCKGMPADLDPPTKENLVAFKTLKEALLNPPVLCLPVFGPLYAVDVDASQYQLS